ncbi:MAG: AAA family ATPase [Pirellulales bacterium]|nr:AAA family ATPase [Pirellulales bacterium]
MKIIRLEVEGYRSLKSQSWYPGDLNVLIGPNASGKSNLLRVIETVSAAARGALGEQVQREGGMDPIVWDGQARQVRFMLKTTPLPPYEDPVRHALTYELLLARLGTTSTYNIEFESLANFYSVESGEHTEPFKLLERDPRHAVVFSIESQRFEASPDSVPENEALLSVAAGPFTANHFVAEFQRELASWTVYQDFQTHHGARIREPQVTRNDAHVAADGQNLVSVLHSLYTSSREFKNEINAAMNAAFGDDFEELIFPPAADQRIQLRIRWKSLNREQSAADLSDGTLRFLFLLAVLANPSPPSLIAIDEPESGLHPSMLPIVAEYARDAATRSQVILTTHSPEFLDAFGDNPPTTTVLERQQGQTIMRVISGDELAYWLKQYTLGELYRSRELEAMK